MTATISEATSVMANARRASVLVAASQNADRPPENDFTATAASGISTITLR